MALPSEMGGSAGRTVIVRPRPASNPAPTYVPPRPASNPAPMYQQPRTTYVPPAPVYTPPRPASNPASRPVVTQPRPVSNPAPTAKSAVTALLESATRNAQQMAQPVGNGMPVGWGATANSRVTQPLNRQSGSDPGPITQLPFGQGAEVGPRSPGPNSYDVPYNSGVNADQYRYAPPQQMGGMADNYWTAIVEEGEPYQPSPGHVAMGNIPMLGGVLSTGGAIEELDTVAGPEITYFEIDENGSLIPRSGDPYADNDEAAYMDDLMQDYLDTLGLLGSNPMDPDAAAMQNWLGDSTYVDTGYSDGGYGYGGGGGYGYGGGGGGYGGGGGGYGSGGGGGGGGAGGGGTIGDATDTMDGWAARYTAAGAQEVLANPEVIAKDTLAELGLAGAGMEALVGQQLTYMANQLLPFLYASTPVGQTPNASDVINMLHDLAVSMVGPDGQIIDIGTLMQRMLGKLDPNSLMGSTFAGLTPGEQVSTANNLMSGLSNFAPTAFLGNAVRNYWEQQGNDFLSQALRATNPLNQSYTEFMGGFALP
jgi:hypothetical protein